MILIEILEKNIKTYLPENLEECDQRQYIEMAALLQRFNNSLIDYQTLRVHAIYKLLNLKRANSTLPTVDEELKNANIYQLSECIDSFFIFKEEKKNNIVIKTDLEIKTNFITNHIPKVKPFFKSYYGPEEAFNNVTFGEYSDALALLNDYQTHLEPEILYQILAVFYRPNKPFSFLYKKANKKVSYQDYDTEAAITKLKKLPEGIVYGFYLLFTSFHRYLATAKIYTNGNEIDLSIIFSPSKTKSTIPGLGFKSIEYQLAESGVFGNTKEVRAINLWDAMQNLYDIVKRDKDQETANAKTK